MAAAISLVAAPLASARTQIADYVSTVIYVYTLLIILYIVIQLLFSVGVRPPYSRTTDAVLGFLRDICEPFLSIFRRWIPSFGGLDFSPILAIVTLQVLNSVIVRTLIHG
ncbi:MAG TPA: YggT family protein [Solirubrobacteraceae bacterium]|nr:YggT family protein [Solirubrobacteraceae bacterium]